MGSTVHVGQALQAQHGAAAAQRGRGSAVAPAGRGRHDGGMNGVFARLSYANERKGIILQERR